MTMQAPKMTTRFLELHGYERPVTEVGEIKGNKFYAFAEISDIPVARYMAFMDVYNQTNHMPTAEVMQGLLNKIKQAANEGRAADVGAYCYMIEEASQMSNEDMFYKLSSITLLLEHESPYYFDWALAAEKAAMIKAAPDDFKKKLWPILCAFLPNHGRGSVGDMATYFEAQKLKLAAIAKVATSKE